MWETGNGTAREEPVVGPPPALLQPTGQRLTGRLSKFERHGPVRLALHDRGALSKRAGRGQIAHSQGDEITTSELAVDRTVEERQIAHATGVHQSLADRPDVFGLQRRLGSDDPVRIPRADMADWLRGLAISASCEGSPPAQSNIRKADPPRVREGGIAVIG